jgi:hypothetical protein
VIKIFDPPENRQPPKTAQQSYDLAEIQSQSIWPSTIRRIHTGCGITPAISPQRPGPSDPGTLGRQVVFVTHSGDNDLKKVTKKIGFNFGANRPGYQRTLTVDTQVAVDTCLGQTPQSRYLAGLVKYYQIALVCVWHFK